MTGSTTYAVLLRAPHIPSAEAIRRAFRTFSHLTDADAIRLAANAQGILQRHLKVDEAKALQQALGREGVAAALVKDEDLRFLPGSASLHRIELTPEALVIFDVLGRPTAVAWEEFSLIAAGAVSHLEISATQTHRTGLGLHPVFGLWPKKTTETRHRLETEHQLILELIAGPGARRFEIQAHQFPFNYVPGCPAAATAEKFVWLVGEFARRAPRALLNRAAQDIRDGIALVRGYPSRQAMLDEMVWLLWARAHSAAPG